MVIRIEDIKEQGLFLDFEEKPEAFSALLEATETGSPEIIAPIQVSLRAIRIQDLVEIEGTVGSEIRLSCSRCLKEFETPLSIPFAVTFTRRPTDLPADEKEEEVQLTAEEMGLITFQGEQIDLEKVVEETLVMGMPLRALCNEACRGLCPQCGRDLNVGQCSCDSSGEFGKFAVLKDFRPDRNKNGKV